MEKVPPKLFLRFRKENNMQTIIKNEFKDHLKVTEMAMDSIIDSIEKAAKLCINGLQNGKKILIFGNGGSAADSQHIAAEITGRYKVERKGLPAIALTTDSSVLTAIGNDFGYLHIFDRQVEALAKKGDILIGISTGGSSKNVVSAIKLANKIGCQAIGFSGKGGGYLNSLCDVNIVVPSDDVPRIQEMHIFVGHTICHLIDMAFKD
jgi:D-sedoheptulose 7-phosphate isomerase